MSRGAVDQTSWSNTTLQQGIERWSRIYRSWSRNQLRGQTTLEAHFSTAGAGVGAGGDGAAAGNRPGAMVLGLAAPRSTGRPADPRAAGGDRRGDRASKRGKTGRARGGASGAEPPRGGGCASSADDFTGAAQDCANEDGAEADKVRLARHAAMSRGRARGGRGHRGRAGRAARGRGNRGRGGGRASTSLAARGGGRACGTHTPNTRPDGAGVGTDGEDGAVADRTRRPSNRASSGARGGDGAVQDEKEREEEHGYDGRGGRVDAQPKLTPSEGEADSSRNGATRTGTLHGWIRTPATTQQRGSTGITALASVANDAEAGGTSGSSQGQTHSTGKRQSWTRPETATEAAEEGTEGDPDGASNARSVTKKKQKQQARIERFMGGGNNRDSTGGVGRSGSGEPGGAGTGELDPG